MALTPLLLTAMNGLLYNNAIDINEEFKDVLDEYVNQPIVKAYRDISGIPHSYYNAPDVPLPIDGINANIRQIFSGVPFIADIYSDTNCNVPAEYITEYLLDWANMIMATHYTMSHANPHAKFIQTFQISMGYVGQMNGVINSTVNGGSVGASTFTSMNEITTGNLTAVTTSTATFGDDLENTGKLLDFSKLKFYGTPHGLMLSLIRTGAVNLLTQEFLNVGIVVEDLSGAIIDSEIAALPEIQKIMYTVFQGISDKKLSDIMLIMNVNIQGMNTLADLLDTRKIFPNSVDYLLAMQNKELVSLFSADIDPGTLANIIPENIAKYNVGFRNTLFQIKSIGTTAVQDLAEQFKTIETTLGLDDINRFDTPLPNDVSTNILNGSKGIAGGQGEDGLFYVTDAVGTPCGTTHIETMNELNAYHHSIPYNQQQEVVDKIEEIVAEAWIADAEYKNDNEEPDPDPDPCVPTSPGDCPWYDWNEDRITFIEVWLQPYYDELQLLIDDLPPPLLEVQASWDASLTQVQTEKATLTDAIDWPSDFGGYPPDQSDPPIAGVGGLCGALWYPLTGPSAKKIVLGFTESIHSLSLKTDLHNAAEVLEKISVSNQGGNAIIGSLREGRNLKGLDDVGVKTDTRIEPTQKNPASGEIKPANT